MQKYSVTIDLSKINKSKIVENTFETKDGTKVTQKNYKMDVIIQDSNKHKVIKATDTYLLKKIGFVCEGQTKEERAQKAESNFIGDVTAFDNIGGGETAPAYPSEGSFDVDSIPF